MKSLNPSECTRHIPPTTRNRRLPLFVREQQLDAFVRETFPFPNDQTAPPHHMKRVGALAYLLAQNLGIDDSEAKKIRKAGERHDIGKALIPNAVSLLTDPNPLSEVAWDNLKQHPLYSVELLMEFTPEIAQMIAEIVVHHHEGVDGSGYPDGLELDQIPLGASVVAVADTYDAITITNGIFRAYNRADSPIDAIAIMRESKKYRQSVVNALVNIVNNSHEGKDFQSIYKNTH